jgi:periplasmic protein TonB
MSQNLKQVEDSSRTRERRLHPRWAPSSLVYVELGGNNGGVVLNIIEDGMALRAAQSLQGELLPRMRFRLPRSQNWIETSGQIVWTGKSEKEIGVRFTDLPDAARDQIKHWIASETSSGELRKSAGSANDTQAENASEPATPESTGWVPKSLMADAGTEGRRRYKISSAIAAAAREGGTPTSVSSRVATPRSSASISPVEKRAEKQIRYPVSTGNAVTAASIGEKRAPLSSASTSAPKSARDLRLNLTSYSAEEQLGVEAQRRSWGIIAAVGSLIIIVSFAAGIAVGGRGLDGLIGFFQKFTSGQDVSTQRSMPTSAEDSASASPAQSSQPDVASDDSEPSAPAEHPTSNRPAGDSGVPSKHIVATESHAPDVRAQDTGALARATGGHNPAKGNTKGQVSPTPKPQVSSAPKPDQENVPPPVSVSNDISSATSSPPTAASASQQQSSPAVSSPPSKPEIPTGTVAASSHFRSIRVPPELRSKISQLGNTLQIGELVSSNEPAYPVEALQQRIEGTVRLHAVIGRDGTIQSVEPVSGPPLLMPTAINTVRVWRYKQTLLGGQPIERDEDITLVFRLKN